MTLQLHSCPMTCFIRPDWPRVIGLLGSVEKVPAFARSAVEISNQERDH